MSENTSTPATGTVAPTFHAAGRLSSLLAALTGDGYRNLSVGKLPANDSTLVDAIRSGGVAVAADGLVVCCESQEGKAETFAIFGTITADHRAQAWERASVTAVVLAFLRVVQRDPQLAEQLYQLLLSASTSTVPEIREFMLALEAEAGKPL